MWRDRRRFWLACLFGWVMSGMYGFSRLAIAAISASGEYMMVYCTFIVRQCGVITGIIRSNCGIGDMHSALEVNYGERYLKF